MQIDPIYIHGGAASLVGTGVIALAIATLKRIVNKNDALYEKLDRVLNLTLDFPPHRHVPGNGIAYPKGFDPPKVESVLARGAGVGS